MLAVALEAEVGVPGRVRWGPGRGRASAGGT